MLTPVVIAPILVPALAIPSTNNELFKQFMNAYLEVQVQSLALARTEPRKRPLKAYFFELYLDNSYLAYYKFSKHCKDHYDMAKAIESNQIPFMDSFLRDTISHRWVKYKARYHLTNFITWPEFK